MKTITNCARYILVCAAFLISSCKNKQVNETGTAFSLSDTMLAKCAFSHAASKELKNEIRLFGKLEADNNKTAQVFSVVGGLVTSINVGLGDYVKQGEVLATIQSSEVANYEQQRQDAINEVAVSEKKLQVENDLFAGKLNTEKDVKVAEAELNKAKANLARLKEIYSIYKFKKGSVFPVVAPINGFVITKKININELLLSEEHEPLFSIANTNEIWAVAYVNESNISQIKENYEADVNTLAFPEITYKGRIEKIYNVIDANTRSMKFRVRIPNNDFQLKPDMNCTVSVRYAEKDSMIAVPSSAVIFDKSKYWVMIFKDRHNLETRRVEPYRQLGDTTYIQSGLTEGETVISRNGMLIYDALND
ncbi:efflux RND transporter periplasmic adaptor subunit [Terrimonas sp.]|uniref:efflux RND transporter periplasmic adaptor subunit n=1 Tax=Terrimonas sp. TaxID=1914338 RepID=UPI000D519DB4|nr:efflux RND transporter periplasmic adaptor subunit [Terrimonas sp.]PVD53921.1 efflux RND transporter periplasmic adaptor subunit [Terrimonas sp.]